MNKVIVLFLIVCALIGGASWNSLQQKNQIEYVAGSTDGVIIYPTFTDIAYSKVGFYKFLLKQCDTCRTAPIDSTNDYNPYALGTNGFDSLKPKLFSSLRKNPYFEPTSKIFLKLKSVLDFR